MLVAGLQVPTARAQSAGTIGLGTKVQAAPAAERYFVEFRSRYAQSYGHSFVVFGRGAAPPKKITADQVAGLHPATDSPIPWFVGHVVPVKSETGASEGDTDEIYVSARYRVVLTRAQYLPVAAYIKKLQATSPVWQAEIYNCNDFVRDIAKFMGLKTPSTMIFPKEFVTQLRALNTPERHAAVAPAVSRQ